YAIIIAVVLSIVGARLLRRFLDWRRDVVRVSYLDGPDVTQPTGASLLEISRAHGLPHASVCGGRGRCSTCRVRVLNANPALPAPTADEARVLNRLVGADTDVRLACQLRPTGKIRVARLLPPEANIVETLSDSGREVGQERVVTVLFADLRDFTSTAEKRLPFDVVYLINQFSNAMGETIESHGGYFDKFLGDGLMAIFGVRDEPDQGARKALAACREMGVALEKLNARLETDLDRPLRMGLGLHSGPAVLGDMGYGPSRRLTAIGDTVNIASRLEAATKNEGCTMCVSDATIRLAKATLPEHLARTVAVRGRVGSLAIYAVSDLSDVAKPELETT
ncbi:MAG: adenylate/guanylate cyclase domain-containing protein, partial [Pseudomonadota bacterium]